MSLPKKIANPTMRRMARSVRDSHWAFMERCARAPVHVCLWNKYNKRERRNELMLCLISGMELMTFVREHRSWFGYGPYNEERTTFAFWLTPVGRSALKRRDPRHDNGVMNGGLVDPGYRVTPIRDFHRDLNEQRCSIRAKAGLSRPSLIRSLVEVIEPASTTPRRRITKASRL